jgi:hypothetical protein
MPPVARDCPQTISKKGSRVLKMEKYAKWHHSASVAGMR